MRTCLIDEDGPDASVLDTLAQNVEALRSVPGKALSQRDLAQATGVNASTIARLLQGANWPTVEVISRLATVFEVEPWQLLAPDQGRAVPQSEVKVSPTGLELARKLDQIQDGGERDRAYAYCIQALNFAAFKMAPPESGPSKSRRSK